MEAAMRAVTVSVSGFAALVLLGCAAADSRRFVSPLPCSAGECEPGLEVIPVSAAPPFVPVPVVPSLPEVRQVAGPNNGDAGNIGIGNTGIGNIGINFNGGDDPQSWECLGGSLGGSNAIY